MGTWAACLHVIYACLRHSLSMCVFAYRTHCQTHTHTHTRARTHTHHSQGMVGSLMSGVCSPTFFQNSIVLSVCVCVCMYTCASTCGRAQRAGTNTHTHTHTHALHLTGRGGDHSLPLFMSPSLCTLCLSVCVPYLLSRIHTHTHAHTDTDTHTHIHTHTHINTRGYQTV